MSNELLRIHDENNNCDLVAVANPMGNFHMSTYAEMQDGTQKPVDGWYLFSKMIEKLGQGGGSEPNVFVIDPNSEEYSQVDASYGDKIYNAFKSGKILYYYNYPTYYMVTTVWCANDCGGNAILSISPSGMSGNVKEFVFSGAND